jgi:hypothetical protein
MDIEDEEYEQEATVMDSEVHHMLTELVLDWKSAGMSHLSLFRILISQPSSFRKLIQIQ